jgi:hypothetical protein
MARSKRLKPVETSSRGNGGSRAQATAARTKPPGRVATLLNSLAFKVCVGAIVLAASGVAHGLRTERWQKSNATSQAAQRLQQIPMTLGPWEATSSELAEDVLKKAEIVGYISRDYINRETGSVVSVLLVCGRPGPIAVHTPDICFRGHGYVFRSKEKQHEISVVDSATPARFWLATPDKESGGVLDYLRVLWSWTPNGTWTAPDNPRLTFASEQVLYKLYITQHLSSPQDPADDDDCTKFVRLLIPTLQRFLFPVDRTDG